jgi:Ca2+-binding RTX toxin-like protein
MPIEAAGANVTADGIATSDRGTYAFQPPAAFFAAGPPAAGVNVFNIVDYGAVASAIFDNRDAIQTAIQAAHDAGGGIVYVPPGTYGIGPAFRADGITPDPTAGGVRLLDNVFLKGAGMGASSLRVIDGGNQSITGIVRSPSGETTDNFGLADLTLDGNRANNPTGKTDGFYCGVTPGSTDTCSDVYVLRVAATNCRGYGFDPHEQTHRLTIQDCVASGNAIDGFTLDYQVDGAFIGNVAVNNDRHGFNIVTTTNDCVFTDNTSHDNGGAGIVVQRGSENIPGPHNLLIEGGEIYGNQSDGVRIVYSNDVRVAGVDIHDNGRNGVRIEGSSHVTLDGNTLTNDSRLNTSTSVVNGSTVGTNAEVYIVQGNDTAGASGTLIPSNFNLISNNVITETAAVVAPYGVREAAGLVNSNQVIDNTISGTGTSVVLLVGADTMLVHHGGAGADTVTGGPGHDYITGGLGNDRLNGGAGDDVLDGGGGTDSLRGGLGNDLYIVDQPGTTIFEAADAGFDRVETSLSSLTLTSNVEQLSYTGNGTFVGNGNSLNNIITGGAGNDTLNGNAGDDTLIGLGGTNTLSGGTGNDTYYVNGGADIIVEGVTAGFDTQYTNFSGTTTIAANVEQLVLYGNATAGAGSAGNDILIAVSAVGPVVLDAGTGNDVLYGSAGADTIIGGSGNDVLIGLAGTNFVDGGAGDDVYLSSSGVDIIVEAVGGGFDTEFTDFAGTTTIAANVEQLVLYGAATIGLGSTENDVLIAVGADGPVVLDAGAGNDVLYGGAAADNLFGGAGNDTLIGLGGVNVMDGGAGDDVYLSNSAFDVINEAADGGFDTQITDFSGTTTMTANVEQLVLYGAATGGTGSAGDDMLIAVGASGPVTLDGGAGNDILYGSSAADNLFGGSGNDTLIGLGSANFMDGGAGDDVYLSSSGDDLIIEAVGGGFDTQITDFTGTTTIAANVEQLVLNGGATIGLGSAGNDVLIAVGAAGAVTLDAGAGNDVIYGSTAGDLLTGGAGDDYIIGYGGNDLMDFRNAGSGADTIADFDSDAAGGQDLIDVSGRGFGAASIGSEIVIAADTDGFAKITIGTDTIKLAGVAVADITANDFIF